MTVRPLRESRDTALDAAEKVAWLRLIRTENVGPITFWRLMDRFGSASAALNALPELSKRGGRKKPLVAWDKSRAEDEIAALDNAGVALITACEPAYPHLLRNIEDAPPVINVMGDAQIFQRQSVAIVGARNASINGRRMAAQLATELGADGYVVASGLARGVDTAAHEASVETGTIAVVAGGVDVIYPKENAGLYERICENGAVIAEAPTGTEPQARHFPRRNRIISGLSLGTVVVEATPKSGSLITARMAAEQGRDVFAVPGSPMDPRARGTNRLIRDGATLVENAGDIIQTLGSLHTIAGLRESDNVYDFTRPDAPQDTEKTKDSDTGETTRIVLSHLTATAITVDELVRECQLPVASVLTALLDLELAGQIERQPGNRVSLVYSPVS